MGVNNNGITLQSRNEFIQVQCPRCASEDYITVYQGHDYLYKMPGYFYVARCTSCEFLYQNPCPSPKHIFQFYPSDYLPHKKIVSNPIHIGKAQWWYRNYVRGSFNWALRSNHAGCNLTPNFIEGGNLLEIGCANGSRLTVLRDEMGWNNLYGIELVDRAAEEARKLGFTVIAGPIEQHLASFPDSFFDVVIASMVLEHLYNPFDVVRLVADKLKPGGQFLFSTIACDSLDAKIYGKYFAGFDFPRHLVHFNKNDIKRMVEPYFYKLEVFHQCAPIDYVRSSSWRLENGDGTTFDEAIVKFGNSGFASLIGQILAQLGLTCRVSCRCNKK